MSHTAGIQFKTSAEEKEVNIFRKLNSKINFDRSDLVYTGFYDAQRQQTVLQSVPNLTEAARIHFEPRSTSISILGGMATKYENVPKEHRLHTASEDSVVRFEQHSLKAILKMNGDYQAITRGTPTQTAGYQMVFVDYIFPEEDSKNLLSIAALLTALEHSGVMAEHHHTIASMASALAAPLHPRKRKHDDTDALSAVSSVDTSASRTNAKTDAASASHQNAKTDTAPAPHISVNPATPPQDQGSTSTNTHTQDHTDNSEWFKPQKHLMGVKKTGPGLGFSFF